MTALSIAARRLGLPYLRIGAAAIAALILAAAAALTIHFLPHRGEPVATMVDVPIPAATAAALIQATSPENANETVGEQAKVINAATPFSDGPLDAAQPFAVKGSDSDYRRALLCLTQAVYYEAAYEPLEGRRAVAQVVLNRLRHPAFPKSVCGVVYQGASTGVCQFTFVCDGALYRAPALGAWHEAEAVAHAALAGYVERSVGEATHYHADYVAPRWAPLLAKVAQIGQHIFYRWPGAWGHRAAFSGRYIGEPIDPALRRFAPAAAVPGAPALDGAITGSPIPHAPNDVGGLLDTSKGWTLHIPGPEDSGSAASRAIASQASGARAATVAASSGAGPTVAGL